MTILQIGVIGDSQTGKTSLINVYNGVGFRENMIATIGYDDIVKELTSPNNINYKLKIIDTAGQEQYDSLTLNTFKKCKGLILVYSIDNENSFNNIKNKWIEKIKDSFDIKNTPIILVGNKIDLKDERNILEEEGEKLADDNNFKFFETSAKTGKNVNEIFQTLFEIIVKDDENNIQNKKDEPNNNFVLDNNGVKIIKKKKLCC